MGDKGQKPQLPPGGAYSVGEGRTASWAADTARRMLESSKEQEKDSEERFLQALAKATAQAIQATSTGGSPSQSRGSSSSSSSGRGSSTPKAPPLLEMIKVLERRRPSEKFDGVSQRLDFEDHLAQFERATDIPGLAARDKLAELKHWFAGLARVQTAKFHRMMDPEAGLRGALEFLREEYSQRASSAEDMLADAMSKGVIGVKDAEGINIFVAQVEEVYALASETDRDQDFHRTSLYRAILSECLPHLKQAWATHIEKKELSRPSFEDFLKFLSMQRKIARRFSELNADIRKPTGKGAKVGATSVEESDEGHHEKPPAPWRAPRSPASEGSGHQRARGPRQFPWKEEEGGPKPKRQGGPQPCPKCKASHPLERCPQFSQMTPKDRVAFVKERRKCVYCLKGNHAAENCFERARCYTCQGDHHFLLHEGGAPTTDGAMQPHMTSA